MAGFIYYFAALGAIVSASLAFPVLVAFGFGETEVGYRMMLYGFLGIFFSIAVLLSIAGRENGLERRAAALLVVCCWFFFPVLVAVPLADIMGISFIKSLFQSVSSFTTTGSMLFENPDTVPKSVIFMLAQFQWMGGIVTLITFILILSPWEIGGLPKIGSVSETASIVASQERLTRFCIRILNAVLFLTIVCFACLLLVGLPPYEAIIFSFTALSTGGIVPVDTNLDLLLDNGGMIIVAIFMMISATSIFWHRAIVRLRMDELKGHRESYFLLLAWLIVGTIMAYRIFEVSGTSGSEQFFSSLSEGIFNAASLVSTSGIQTRTGIFALLVPSFVIILVMIGSGCFSTGGGIKIFRLGVVFRHSSHELDRLIYPNSIHSNRFIGGSLSLEFMKGIWGFFAVWVLVLGLCVLLISASGLNFQAAFTVSVAALSNAGPVYGTFWAEPDALGWLAYSQMSWFQLSVLSLAMILGRLEIFVVLASIAAVLRGGMK